MNWVETTVGDFCPFVYGKGLPKTKRESGPVPVYGSNGCVDYHLTSYVKGPGIIIGRKGSVGAVHLSEEPFWPIDTSFYLEKESLDELKFTYYLLKSLGLEHMNSDSAVPGLNRENAHDLPIRIPEKKEDRESIGRWLSMYDDKIELNLQTNQTLEHIAQAIFKSWFVNFEPTRAKIAAKQEWDKRSSAAKESENDDILFKNYTEDSVIERAAMAAISGKTLEELNLLNSEQQEQLKTTAALFPDALIDSELGEIPEGWEVKALDEIAHYQNGLALQKFRPENDQEYLPVLKIAQLKKGVAEGLEKASVNIKPECIVDNGDVIFSWSGSLVVDVWCGGKAALNQHLFKVTSADYPKWLYFYWTKHHLTVFQQVAADKAVTMGHIKRSHLSEAKCVVPSSEIKAFDLIAEFLEKQISRRLENNLLQQTRDSLLPKLLCGEIDIDTYIVNDNE